MEHRWGKRTPVEVGVTLHPAVGGVARGRIANVSPSGALVLTDLHVPVLTRVLVEIPGADSPPEAVSAYVARQTSHGLGLEWTEFSPPAIATLLSRAAAKLGRNAEPHPQQDGRRRNHALGGGIFEQQPWR